MILFVDDERRIMDSYKAELEFSGYDVHFESDVDLAWSFFLENIAAVDLLILDVAMPAGVTFENDETDGGLSTGVKFYQRIREKSQEQRVMILTNFADKEVSDSIMKEDKRCWQFSKASLLPFELAEEVKKILRG